MYGKMISAMNGGRLDIVPPEEYFVLLVINDHCNEFGECKYHYKFLAATCEIDEDAFLNLINSLIDRGVLEWCDFLVEDFTVRLVRRLRVLTNKNRLRPNQYRWSLLRAQVFERDDYTCRYCGERNGNLECDHIQPVSKGGGHELSNLATACKSCNRRKSNKTGGRF